MYLLLLLFPSYLHPYHYLVIENFFFDIYYFCLVKSEINELVNTLVQISKLINQHVLKSILHIIINKIDLEFMNPLGLYTVFTISPIRTVSWPSNRLLLNNQVTPYIHS